MPRRPRHLCQFEACSIQTCLKKNDFDESHCTKEIEQMKDCCKAIQYKSYICEGFDPDRINVKAAKEGCPLK